MSMIEKFCCFMKLLWSFSLIATNLLLSQGSPLFLGFLPPFLPISLSSSSLLPKDQVYKIWFIQYFLVRELLLSSCIRVSPLKSDDFPYCLIFSIPSPTTCMSLLVYLLRVLQIHLLYTYLGNYRCSKMAQFWVGI